MPTDQQIADAQAAVIQKLADLDHQGRQNSPEAIEFKAYRDLLAWLTQSGDDPQRFQRIVFRTR